MFQSKQYVGVFLGSLSYSLLSVGQVLQKKGASEIGKIEENSVKQNFHNFFTNKIWLTGFFITIFQWYIYIVAISLAPLSTISSLMGLGLIVLVIFSRIYLKEEVFRREVVGMLIIVMGIAILGITNYEDKAEMEKESNDIIKRGSNVLYLMLHLNSIIFVGALLIIVAVLIFFSIKKGFYLAGFIFGFSSGVFVGIGQIFSKFLVSSFDYQKILSSLIGPEFWICLFGLFCVNSVAPILQQIGFQKGKAILVSSLNTMIGLLVSVFGGVIIFSEFSYIPLSHVILKIFAIILVVVGIFLLSILRAAKETVRVLQVVQGEDENVIEEV